MKLRLQDRIAVKLVAQMVLVVAVIALVFYSIISIQTREMQKRIFDKAKLFSSILGTHLDKIVGDSLIAYRELQEATTFIVRNQTEVEELKIIAPECIVLSSSSAKDIWQVVEPPYLKAVEEVVHTRREKSILEMTLGKELIVHFMPLFDRGDSSKRLIGVMQIVVRFPTRQESIISSVRSNKSAYFKEEASGFAKKLARDLQKMLNAVQKNFAYLEALIKNMLIDEEIEDIKIFSKDLRVLGSASSGRQASFLGSGENQIYAKVMATEEMLSLRIKTKKENLIKVVSPLYLTKNSRRKVAGTVEIVLSLGQIQNLIWARRNNILLMSLIIIITVCLLIGLFFKANIFVPIVELISLTERIGRGDFSQRIKITSRDEIGCLAEALNKMSDDLKRSKEEVEQWNIKLQERVDKATEELKQKQAQLIESEKMASLGVLSSGIAHEINNPLGVVLGQTQMLLNKFRTEPDSLNTTEANELLMTIEESAKRCSRVVKSLLQFARKKELIFKGTDITVVLENALVFTQSRLEKKGIKIIRSFPDSVPLVEADPVQLEQVFINILLNAEQSMKQAGRIKIDIKLEYSPKGSHPEFITISFEDTGRGIPQKYLSKIFEPFFSTKEPGEGAGLGLSVSYGIIKAHRGNIEVKSQVNIGTTVIVKLPLKRKS
jgi:signal transduction histidine kinase